MKRPVVQCRRQFLRGSGGIAIALPFLPSLFARRSSAAQPVLNHKPNMFLMGNDHGGAFRENFFPADTMLTDQMDVLPGHRIRSGRLVAQDVGGYRTLSPVLKARDLTDRLVGKLNIIQGLSVTGRIGHHRGGHFGNYAATLGGMEPDGMIYVANPTPTIDQVAAYSTGFYDSTPRLRVMNANYKFNLSFRYSDPVNWSGTIVNGDATRSTRQLFSQVYAPAMTSEPKRPLIVDRVLQNYRRLRQNGRLSILDKQRLDDHIGRLSELEGRLAATTAMACPASTLPRDDASAFGGDAAGYEKRAQLVMDVIALGFSCGTSRLGMYVPEDDGEGANWTGNWHQDYAHQWSSVTQQPALVEHYQFYFEKVFLYLAKKLDAIDTGDGRTLLDDSVLAWTQESGMFTHDCNNIPVVLAGNAAGYFNTGNYVDYQNRENTRARQVQSGHTQYLGLTYNQWLANMLLAMRVPRTEFERWGYRGYGHALIGTTDSYNRPYYGNDVSSSPYYQMASDPLPVIA